MCEGDADTRKCSKATDEGVFVPEILNKEGLGAAGPESLLPPSRIWCFTFSKQNIGLLFFSLF